MQEFVEVDPLNLEAYEEPAKNKTEIKIELEKRLNAPKPPLTIKDQLESNKSDLNFEHDCDLCSKKFATEENLRKHVKLRHHFQCRFCSRTFSEQKFLQKHVETMCTKLKNSVIGSCKIFLRLNLTSDSFYFTYKYLRVITSILILLIETNSYSIILCYVIETSHFHRQYHEFNKGR